MSATDERFTPPETLALRDRVWPLGTDTDPAWHPRSFSRARLCYEKCNDGLAGGRRWVGRVWLNPPWSDVMPWLVRLLAHMAEFHAELRGHEGMLCVRNDPSTAWFKLAAERADAVAFLGERTRYWQWDPHRRRVERCGTPEFGSVVFYFGAGAAAFVEVFSAGHIALRLREHSTCGTVPCMAKGKKTPGRRSGRPPLEDRLRAQVRAVVGELARAHPYATLGELVSALGSNAELLMGLRVRDLWPEAAQAPAKADNGLGAQSPVRRPMVAPPADGQTRVEQIRGIIAGLGRNEFTTADITSVLGCSRQTVLRALERIPEVKKVGKLKSARHVVQQ